MEPTTDSVPRLPFVYGEQSPMQDVARTALRIAPSDATVLLTGETGTGKEVLARFVHLQSSRAKKAFVPVNCGAIPEALLESELFGHTKGAFTGAAASRKGRVALAEGGTLFLDEIGELPLNLQVKLLRLLQERTYEPLGSAESIPANFRLIAATHRDLAADVEAGRFRRDLYYRLVVCPIKLPALRDRPKDIVPIFSHFWSRRGEERPVDRTVLAALEQHDWPGNVRELENLIERLSVCSEGPVIHLEHLPMEVMSEKAGALIASHVGKPLSVAPMLPAPVRPPVDEEAERMALREAVTEMAAAAMSTSTPAGQWPPSEGATPGSLVHFGAPPPGSAPTPIRAEAPAAVPPPAAPPMMSDAAPGAPIELHDLVAGTPVSDAPLRPLDLPGLLRAIEDQYIDRALAQTDGNKKAAADLLGLQRTTLVEKLRRRERSQPAAASSSPSMAGSAAK